MYLKNKFHKFIFNFLFDSSKQTKIFELDHISNDIDNFEISFNYNYEKYGRSSLHDISDPDRENSIKEKLLNFFNENKPTNLDEIIQYI